MFNQNRPAFSPTPLEGKQDSPKPYASTPISQLPKPQADKIRSSQKGSTSGTGVQGNPKREETVGKAEIQQGGGKLDSNKNENKQELINAIHNKPQILKKEEDPPLSALGRLKNQLFAYTKLKNKNFNKDDLKTIQKTFNLLSGDKKQRENALRGLRQKQGYKKIKIDYFHNSTQPNQNQAKYFFSLIIIELMEQNKYLSFQGAQELVVHYLTINKSIFYLDQKFQLSLIQKQCNVKSFNQIESNSIRCLPYFKKMIKEIKFIKDVIIVEFNNFYSLITQYADNQTQNDNLMNELIKSLSDIVWKSFKNLIDSQQRNIENYFEIKILLTGLHTFLYYNDKMFPEGKAKQILTTFIKNWKLIEASDHIHSDVKRKLVSYIDEIILHLMLNFPYSSKTCYQLVQFMEEQQFNRYSYLSYFSDHHILAHPLQSAQQYLFIEAFLENEKNGFSSMQPLKEDFVLQSIYNIIKSNIPKFLKHPAKYRKIRQYIQYMRQKIQDFSEQYDQSCFYSEQYYSDYVNICRFAKLFGLLSYPTYNQLIRPQRIIRNQSTIYNFLWVSATMIVPSKNISQSQSHLLINQSINTQPIHQFFHRMIIHSPSDYHDSLQFLKAKGINDRDLQQQLFGTYLMCFAENGNSTQTCILSLTKLIQQHCHSEVKVIMNHFERINNNIHQDQDQEIEISKLEYIIDNLFKKKENFVPLAKNILCILKYAPKYSGHCWTEKIFEKLKDLPQGILPEKICDYSVILDVSLKFIQNNPKSLQTIQKYFNFKFANEYLCSLLEINEQNGAFFNKHIRCSVYKPIVLAVRLLKSMTQLYLKEKENNQVELVPYELRKLLESQNKFGDFQLTGKNRSIPAYGISYHFSLLTILLSREIKLDADLRVLYPSFKNQILETLINLNAISLQLKHQANLKISVFYNKQYQIEINKKINMKNEAFEAITKDPTYLGLQYLISSGNIDFKQKKSMFDRIKQVRLQKSYSNMRSRSHFIIVYWKQIQNGKLNIEPKVGWEYVRREIEQIYMFLSQSKQQGAEVNLEQKQQIKEILKNLYNFSDILKDTSLQHYVKYFLNIHQIYFDLQLNNLKIISQENKNGLQIYQSSLLQFFNCKSFISSKLSDDLKLQKGMHVNLLQFLRTLIKTTYMRNYQLQNDLRILTIVQFGLAFLIELQHPSLLNWLQQIRKLIVQRPQKHSPILTKQIIIRLLLSSRLKENIHVQEVQFGNSDWLLMMNEVEQNEQYGNIIVSQLYNIYERHPIFFISASHYLTKIAKSKYLELVYKDKTKTKNMVNILIDVLKKSMQAQKSYYSIWIVQILLQMLLNKNINKHIRNKICGNIREYILTLTAMHQRIAELLSKIGSFYSSNYKNLWKMCYDFNKSVSSYILFSQKQELQAYLRLLTFIFLMQEQQKNNLQLSDDKHKECNMIEREILQSFLLILPIVSIMLKDQNEKEGIKSGCQWQEKIKNIMPSSKMLATTTQMKSSGVRQLQSEKLSSAWKKMNGLEILHQVSNINLASTCALWLSAYKNSNLAFNNIVNAETYQQYFQYFLKFLQSIKRKILFLHEGSSDQIIKVISFLNNNIYTRSIQISKELLFTNMKALSSGLSLDYGIINDKLRISFQSTAILMDNIIENYEGRVKNDKKLKKLFEHFLSSCKNIKKYIDIAGSKFKFPPDNFSNATQISYKTRTVYSHR